VVKEGKVGKVGKNEEVENREKLKEGYKVEWCVCVTCECVSV
jgi:ABC-type cobalamin/Fe3+-siderophores transport system ATPase subunit